MSGYPPLDAPRSPRPSPLPVPAAPVAGETLTSFTGRLVAVNRTAPEALPGILPPWFRIKARWHDDRWQPGQLMPWADDAAARIALISGTTAPAIRNALPDFGTRTGQPDREPVPVHLPAHHQVCLRHGIWLSRAGTPQFSVSECPGHHGRRAPSTSALAALHDRAADLRQGPGCAATRQSRPAGWKQRMRALITSNPRTVIESCPQELFTAAGYPETVSTAAAAAH